MIKATMKVGVMDITLEAQTMQDVCKFGGLMGELPKICDQCDSEAIHLSHRSPGGNDYFSVRCSVCTAEANFGLHKEGGTMYWKRDKMEIYQGNGGNTVNITDKPKKQQQADDSLPF